MIGNWFCTHIILKKSVINRVFNKRYTFTICVFGLDIFYSKNKVLIDYYRLLVYKILYIALLFWISVYNITETKSFYATKVN